MSFKTANPSVLTRPITFNLLLAGASSSAASTSGTSGTSGTPHMSSGTCTGTSGRNASPHGSGTKLKATVEEPSKNFIFYPNY